MAHNIQRDPKYTNLIDTLRRELSDLTDSELHAFVLARSPIRARIPLPSGEAQETDWGFGRTEVLLLELSLSLFYFDQSQYMLSDQAVTNLMELRDTWKELQNPHTDALRTRLQGFIAWFETELDNATAQGANKEELKCYSHPLEDLRNMEKNWDATVTLLEAV